MTSTASAAPPELSIPAGFFDEIAAQLDSEEAEDIADAVISTCISRGILHPELEDDPADELRAQQLREVFGLLGAVTAAVADGTIVPRQFRHIDIMDPDMEQAWEGFTASASDPEAAARTSEMIATGQYRPSDT